MFCFFRIFCSLFPLLLANIIISILGFIFNIIFIIYIKKSGFIIIGIIILIQIGFIISLIISSILLHKYFKKKNNCVKLTCSSIILSIFLFMDTTWSIANFSFCMHMIYEQNNEGNSFPKHNIALFVINFCFCFILLNLWISLIKFNKEKKCYFENCCCLNRSKSRTKQVILINPNEKINIEFHLTSGRKITIIIPSFISVEKLIKFFFKIMKINKTDKNNICFIKEANKLNISSNIFVKNEFINSNHVLVIDQNNIIHPKENLFIY